mmetsp:Transcript_7318/g.15215  ORF Transcript_7318/g.15215 Transcript_7318/m.15215 type:complete len:238 (-) Transcript_7318:2025-2738(-)
MSGPTATPKPAWRQCLIYLRLLGLYQRPANFSARARNALRRPSSPNESDLQLSQTDPGELSYRYPALRTCTHCHEHPQCTHRTSRHDHTQQTHRLREPPIPTPTPVLVLGIGIGGLRSARALVAHGVASWLVFAVAQPAPLELAHLTSHVRAPTVPGCVHPASRARLRLGRHVLRRLLLARRHRARHPHLALRHAGGLLGHLLGRHLGRLHLLACRHGPARDVEVGRLDLGSLLHDH